ncbi:MAG TPA: hypothetical protein PKH39_15415 [Woeseiaceae bacterium]|nr:hypothetical protein [Woeseiaceae bacterium]
MADHPHRRRLDIELFTDFLAHRLKRGGTLAAATVGLFEFVHDLDPRKSLRQWPAAAFLSTMRGNRHGVALIVAAAFFVYRH